MYCAAKPTPASYVMFVACLASLSPDKELDPPRMKLSTSIPNQKNVKA